MSSVEGRPSQRERRKRETRDALRASALRLFSVNGFKATTADQIAAAVGVSRRTFFLHFATKEAVMVAHVEEQLALLRAELAAAPASLAPARRAEHAVTELARSMQQQDDLLLQLRLLREAQELLGVNLIRFTAFEEAVADSVRCWLEEGGCPLDPALDAYAELLGTVCVATLRSALNTWRRRGGTEPLVPLLEAQFTLLRAGLELP